ETVIADDVPDLRDRRALARVDQGTAEQPRIAVEVAGEAIILRLDLGPGHHDDPVDRCLGRGVEQAHERVIAIPGQVSLKVCAHETSPVTGAVGCEARLCVSAPRLRGETGRRVATSSPAASLGSTECSLAVGARNPAWAERSRIAPVRP